jgi:geranylgeranyl reductase family protein
MLHSQPQAEINPRVMYDVLIIGAGPAGTSAAFYLAASHKVSVLLVDRYPFPREKACGDALMPPAVDELAKLGLVGEIQQRFQPVKHIGIWMNEQRMPFDAPIKGSERFRVGYVAPRAEFDALLLQHALEAGALWMDHVIIHKMRWETGFITAIGLHSGAEISLTARLLIIANGSGSSLALQLRQELESQGLSDTLTQDADPRARFVATRGYYAGIENLEDGLEFYFPKQYGIPYCWAFPMRGGMANVGAITRSQLSRKEKPEGALHSFLQSKVMRDRLRPDPVRLKTAPVWAGLRGTALYGERMLVVGDAAALVDLRSAEGISGALYSGRLAAETALKSQDYSLTALSGYGKAIRERYARLYEEQLSQIPL